MHQRIVGFPSQSDCYIAVVSHFADHLFDLRDVFFVALSQALRGKILCYVHVGITFFKSRFEEIYCHTNKVFQSLIISVKVSSLFQMDVFYCLTLLLAAD